MLRKKIFLILLCLTVVTNSGCALLGAALSAAAAYGIYQATNSD